jgi:hypothetical protein
VRVPRRQRVLKRHAVIAYARCNEQCTVAMSTLLRIGRRSFHPRKVGNGVAAGRRLKLRARLSRGQRRALRRALRRHRRVRVRVALRARDGAGNRSRLVHRRVRVRR